MLREKTKQIFIKPFRKSIIQIGRQSIFFIGTRIRKCNFSQHPIPFKDIFPFHGEAMFVVASLIQVRDGSD